MALPQKAIEQLQREPVLTPGWSGRLLMFSSTLFFITASIYLGIVFGYKPYLDEQVAELKNRVEKFNRDIPPQEQDKLITLYSQAANLRSILDQQKIASLVIPWIEENTHKDIFFSNLSVSLDRGSVALAGKSRSLQSLAEQLVRFNELPEVEEVQFGGTGMDAEGFWSANFVILFKDRFFESKAFSQNV